MTPAQPGNYAKEHVMEVVYANGQALKVPSQTVQHVRCKTYLKDRLNENANHWNNFGLAVWWSLLKYLERRESFRIENIYLSQIPR